MCCLLLLVAFAASLRWRMGCCLGSRTADRLGSVSVTEGALKVAYVSKNQKGYITRWPVLLSCGILRNPMPWKPWFDLRVIARTPLHPGPNKKDRAYILYVPLWLPFVVVLISTAFFWHRDRRILPGHCRKCGYDLTGNVSGVCPECGERI